MKGEEWSSMSSYWKHWVVYTTCTFLFIFVLLEFAISLSLISMIAPSPFMYYLTPIGLFFGESLVSFFASALLIVGLFVVLRQKVYVKNEKSLKFEGSNSYLLLPFYLTALISLGAYISLIPLELSNLVTYVVFIILFESFIEHIQVSEYGEWIKGLFEKEPSALEEMKPVESTKVEVQEEEVSEPAEVTTHEREQEDLEEKLADIEEHVKEPVKKQPFKVKKKVSKVKGSIEEELEELEEEMVKEPVKVEKEPMKVKKEPVKVEKKPVKVEKEPIKVEKEPVKLEKEPLEKPAKDEFITCPICGFEESVDAEKCAECGEPLEGIEEGNDTFSELFDEIEREFDEEEIHEEITEEEPEEITEEDIEKELDEELRSLEEETELKEIIECPVCGAEFDKSEGICPECGEPVDEDEEDDLFSELI